MINFQLFLRRTLVRSGTICSYWLTQAIADALLQHKGATQEKPYSNSIARLIKFNIT